MIQQFIHTLPQILNKVMCCSLLCGVLALFACSSDTNDNIPTTPVTPVEPDIPYFLSFSIGLEENLISTKTYEGTEFGTNSENFVNEVRIVLYGEDNKVKEVFDYNIKSNETGDICWTGSGLAPGDPADFKNKSKFKTVAKKVDKMNYKALVIINKSGKGNISNDLGNLTIPGSPWNTLYNLGFKISNSNNAGGIATPNNFLMSNVKELISVNTESLGNSMNQAHSTPVSIEVGRVAGKTTLLPATIAEINTNSGAKVDNLTWELDITNKYTYLVSHHAYWGIDTREFWYAEDPNYSGLVSTVNWEDNFFINSAETVLSFSSSLNQSQYCLENTMNVALQKEDKLISRVLIRCQYKPANVSAIGKSYYVLNKQVITPEDMKIYAKLLAEDPNYNDDICKAIKAAQNEGYYISTLTGLPIRGGYEVKNSFTTNNGIKYYYEGVNYYAVKILHFGNSDSGNPGYGHYGVLRNTHYKVTIKKIEGPGSPTLYSSDIKLRSGFTDITENDAMFNNIFAEIESRD